MVPASVVESMTMKSWMLAVVLFFTGLGAVAKAQVGTLVVVGGGPTPEGLHKQVMELAGGTNARVLVVPLASSPVPEISSSVKAFRDAGGAQVEQISSTDPKTALSQVRQADVLWFPGGSQTVLMEALRRLGVVEAIRTRHAQGAVLGGTSAGAAVMSQTMIAGTEPAPKGTAGDKSTMKPQLGEGLGLWPAVIVDQHFLKRGREPRLRAAVQARPDLLGVGIDESTFVLVRGNVFEVGGKSSVIVLDARGGELRRKELKAGDKFEG